MKKRGIFIVVAIMLLCYQVSANTAPLINNLDEEIIICEGSALAHEFNVIDLEGDSLTVGVSPGGPFFARQKEVDIPAVKMELYSANFTKEQANQIYQQTVFVSDGEYSDIKKVRIKVLEKNNPPLIAHQPTVTLFANQTEPFVRKIEVTDKESGANTGAFTFTVETAGELNVTIDNTGTLQISPSPQVQGIHEVNICVTDTGVENLQDKIGFCGEDEITATSCTQFKVAVVETNTAPTILSHTTINDSITVIGTHDIKLEVYNFDPDGTVPDIYWYIDKELKHITTGKEADTFTYAFGCEVWGKHNARVVISDGLQNDSLNWQFDVVRFSCTDGLSPGERINKESCEESWACFDWDLCQNAEQSRAIGVLVGDDYLKILEQCTLYGLNEETCGFQIRSCFDINECRTASARPKELQFCEFVHDPSCSDERQNCHGGKCEILTDCGGVCPLCRTCSDGVQNQGEEGVDCGSPCAQECPQAILTDSEKTLKQGLIGAILVFLLLAILQIVRVSHEKKTLEEPPKRGRVIEHSI